MSCTNEMFSVSSLIIDKLVCYDEPANQDAGSLFIISG